MLLTSAVAFTGCSDFLDAENKSAGESSDEYFNTEAGLEAFRTNAYYNLKDIVAQVDIFDDGTDLYRTARAKVASDLQAYALSADNKVVTDFYTNCYKLINNANGILQYGKGEKYVGDALFLRAYGYYMLVQQFGMVPYSDKFINDDNRDHPRVELATVYENIIADLNNVLSSDVPESSQDGYASKQAAKALLAKTYLAAGWDLETELTDAAAGTYTIKGTSYFEKAAQIADELVAQTPLTLSFDEKWSQALDYSNPENYFSVQYLRDGWPGETNEGSHTLQNEYGNYYGATTANGQKACSSNHVPTLKSLYLFDANDERYEGTFMTAFYRCAKSSDNKAVVNWPKDGYYSYYNADNNNKILWYYDNANLDSLEFEAKLTAMKDKFAADENTWTNTGVEAYRMQDPVLKYTFNADGSFKKPEQISYYAKIDGAMQFGPCVRKFDDVNSTIESTVSYRPIVILHASDIYLVAAEAYHMMGNDGKALERLNSVRNRAGLASLNSLSQYEPSYSTSASFGNITMLDLILDERARELYAERTRWEDLRRTRQLVRYNVEFNPNIESVANMSNGKGEVKWYRPIPTTELNSNTALTTESQNPGY